MVFWALEGEKWIKRKNLSVKQWFIRLNVFIKRQTISLSEECFDFLVVKD